MYNDYYNLKENPFSITADPDFFFTSSKHSEAFSHLVYGINQRKGILLVTGEIGTGKTTLCRSLLNQVDDKTHTALILNPSFSETQLLRMILHDFNIHTRARSKFDLIDRLNEFLLEESGLGNNVVLIIDECQNLSVKQLEQIRLLSNLETEKHKLLQIILVGQPELCDKLKLPELRQLNQRISVRFHLLPLNQEEVKDYIHHRLDVATNEESKVSFTDEALDKIFTYSGGTPRMVNILCDRALLAGFASETHTIDAQIVHQCAREVGRK